MHRAIIAIAVLLVAAAISLLNLFAAVAFLLAVAAFVCYKVLRAPSVFKAEPSLDTSKPLVEPIKDASNANERETPELENETPTLDDETPTLEVETSTLVQHNVKPSIKIYSIILAAIAGLCLLSMMMSLFLYHWGVESGFEITEMKKYSAILEPKDSSLREFILREEVILSVPTSRVPPPFSDRFREDDEKSPSGRQRREIKDRSFRLKERTISSSNSGFLTMEVYFLPLNVSRDVGWKELATSDGSPIYLLLNNFECDNVDIQLRNMPKGSFESATDSEKLERHPFADVEAVHWSVRNLEPSLGVSFIKPGFEKYRPVLSPFIGLSSMNGWVAAVLVIVITLGIAITVDILKDRIKVHFGKAQQEKSKGARSRKDERERSREQSRSEDDEDGKGSSENNELRSGFE